MISLLFALVGCGGAEQPAPSPAHDDHAEHAEHAAPAEKPAADDHDHHVGGNEAMAMKKAPDGAKVMFVSPHDGDKVHSPVKVVMGVESMTVKPAGELEDGTGHHHIIIDGEAPAYGDVVPKDDTHIHFGGGQTEVELELKPGKHTLTLQFADGLHRSYGPDLTASITVEVE